MSEYIHISLPKELLTYETKREAGMNSRNIQGRGLHSGKYSATQPTSSTVFKHLLNVKRTKEILLGRVCYQA